MGNLQVSAGLWLLAASMASGAIVNVPADQPTINAAIAAATVNDTIQIAVKFSATLVGNIGQVLIDNGLPEATSGPVTVPFSVTLNGIKYFSPLVLQVTKNGKSGKGE